MAYGITVTKKVTIVGITIHRHHCSWTFCLLCDGKWVEISPTELIMENLHFWSAELWRSAAIVQAEYDTIIGHTESEIIWGTAEEENTLCVQTFAYLQCKWKKRYMHGHCMSSSCGGGLPFKHKLLGIVFTYFSVSIFSQCLLVLLLLLLTYQATLWFFTPGALPTVAD